MFGTVARTVRVGRDPADAGAGHPPGESRFYASTAVVGTQFANGLVLVALLIVFR